MSPLASFSDNSELSDSDSRSSSTQPMSISPTSPVETNKTLVENSNHSSSKLGHKLAEGKISKSHSSGAGVGLVTDKENPSQHSTSLNSGFLQTQSPEHHGKHRIEPDPESFVSDVSEMADSIKEHLANVQIIRKEDLEAGNTMCLPEFVVQQRILRKPGETDEEFAKRIRKINYLSLAQEFAELKKTDSQALPFDLHKANPEDIASPSSDTSSSTDVEDTCDSELPTPCESHKDFAETIMATQSMTTASSLSTRLEALHVSPKVRPDVDQRTPANSTITDNTQNNNTRLDAQNQNLDFHNTKKGKDSSVIDNSVRQADATKHMSKTDSPRTKHREHTSNQRSTPKADRRQKSQSTMLTKPGGERTGSQRKSLPSAQELNDFDVYNIETALPQMDWAALEQQLKKAAEEEQQKLSRRNDREAIRQKLAMAGPEEEYYGGERMAKKPNLQTRLQSGMNLQLCYVNDVAGEQEAAAQSDSLPPPVPNQPQQPGTSQACTTDLQVSHDKAAGVADKAEEKDEDFMSRQARLQDEARMALAQVRPMAHMQLEIEKQLRKKSPIAEMVGQGQIKGAVPGLGDRRKKLTRLVMQDMNFAQLQVVVNDLHTQIESLNEELVRLLVDRDDLHMEQDSMLVDIEDLTRRAQEVSSRVNQRTVKKSSSTSGKR